MKLWILISVVVGVLLLAVPRAASAEEAQPPQHVAEPAAAEGETSSKAEKPYCLKYTGSRIRPPAGQCANTRGRVYSREDIERTGDVNLNDALRRLDPSLH